MPTAQKQLTEKCTGVWAPERRQGLSSEARRHRGLMRAAEVCKGTIHGDGGGLRDDLGDTKSPVGRFWHLPGPSWLPEGSRGAEPPSEGRGKQLLQKGHMGSAAPRATKPAWGLGTGLPGPG